MNYNEMTDAEVNKAVARKRGFSVDSRCCNIYGLDSTLYFLSESGSGSKLNYCNNPADMMPIAFENKISLEYCDMYDEWRACGDLAPVTDNNPLRAIAVCYLMMED